MCRSSRRTAARGSNPNGRPFVRTVLFPKSSATIIDNWQVIGLRGTGSDSYTVEDLFVPQKYTCSRDNEAERREGGLLYKFTSGMVYAMGFSNVSLGHRPRRARRVYRAGPRQDPARRPQPAAREQRNPVAGGAMRGAGSGPRAPGDHATLREMWDEAQRSGQFLPEQHARLRLASTWAIQQARDVVAQVYSSAGATAIFTENPFERRLRDIHAGTQQGQGRPVHRRNRRPDPARPPPEGRMFR